jgi:diguanylate cyclase (GGDEF)-like protein
VQTGSAVETRHKLPISCLGGFWGRAQTKVEPGCCRIVGVWVIEPTTKSKVLIVDDEPQVRAALARLASAEGFVPVLAASAEEALALAQADVFRAAVTDVAMPGMGGLALLHRISPLQPGCRFVVVTGLSHVEPTLLPRDHGCQVFYKPWDAGELRAALSGRWRSTSSSSIPSPSSGRSTLRLLLLEPSEVEAQFMTGALRLAAPGEHEIVHERTVEGARMLLAARRFDVACIGLSRVDIGGLDAIVRLQAEQPSLGIVAVLGDDDEDLALQAVQAGAQDCLVHETLDGPMLAKALRYARERKRAELALSQVAVHDQVTGLANRTLFRQRIAQALVGSSGSRPFFAIFLVDLHRFKTINEAFGHDTGDAFLQEVGVRLRRVTRESDSVARLGADEFALLVKDIRDQERAEEFGHRILSELSAPAELPGVRLVPAAAIGIALCPSCGSSSEELLAAADAALRLAKSQGRNGLAMFGDAVKSRALQRMTLEGELRESLSRAEFALEFQPQVDERGQIIAAEALLRWRRAGQVSPVEAYEFMGVMEETGLIADLGPWIIKSACSQLRNWRKAGLPVRRVAINVAAVQVAKHDLVTLLRDVREQYRLQPTDIELELTETSLLQDSDHVRNTLQTLKDQGYRLALDDFGTGFSSLSYLQRLPITTIKIDRSYTKGIGSPGQQRELVGGLIALAHRLGLDVVAEGVEDVEQSEALTRESCDVMQGYLFGRAMTPEAFGVSVRESQIPPLPHELARKVAP